MSKRGTVSWLVLAVLSQADAILAGSVEIVSRQIDCVAADRFPQIEALLTPAEQVSMARVLFRTKSSQGWYWVRMERAADSFAAVLPKPGTGLKEFRYYIEATDAAFETSQTPEYVPEVVTNVETCRGKMLAKTVASAQVITHVPTGYKVPSVPGGFSVRGVVRAGEERLGAFPNMSLATTLVAAGAVAAGAVAAGLAVANGSSPQGVQGTLVPTNGGTVTLSTVSPPVGSRISLKDQDTLMVSLSVVARDDVPPGLTTLQLVGPKSSCATFTSPHGLLGAGIQENVTLTVQMTPASFGCPVPSQVRSILVNIDDFEHSIRALGFGFAVNYDLVP